MHRRLRSPRRIRWGPTDLSSSNTATRTREELDGLFKKMGFAAVARHRSKNVTLYRQGDINFILNAEPGSFAAKFAQAHGPRRPPWRSGSSTRSMRSNARLRSERGLVNPGRTDGLNIPALEGIGGLQIYLVDAAGRRVRSTTSTSSGE